MNRPYVVSADIYLLLQKWSARTGFTLPPAEFFAELRVEMSDKLSEIFGPVELVGERKLQQGFTEFFLSNSLPIVSLDRIYVGAEHNLELTRAVDENGNDLGLRNRAGTPSLARQLRSLQDKLSGGTARRKIALVDDVIFSGDLLLKVVDMLESINFEVASVYAGIGIADGVDKVKARNIPIACVCQYDEVIDEVCERDFYPGVPLSGRLIAGIENTCLPYILPFGKPGKWASIPEDQQLDFSLFCWQQTSRLFAAIEQYSRREVFCHDLGRLVAHLPTNGVRYVEAIKTVDALADVKVA